MLLAATALLSLLAPQTTGPVAEGSSLGFPPVQAVRKLYAARDFRGKVLPPVVAEEWVGKQPKLQGKVVVVEFFDTYSQPSQMLAKTLTDWQLKFGEEIAVVGIGSESIADVKAFQKQFKVGYSLATDSKRRLFGEIGVHCLPHVLVVSPDGVVRWQGWPGNPEDPLTPEKMERIVRASKEKSTS